MKIHFVFCLLAICSQMAFAQERCDILSLNNSLIDYNNQPEMFNEMAKAQGKDAHWESRTQLGRTLIVHYNNALSHEAAMSRPWNYVILQEQSALPRNFPEVFMQTIELWWRAFNDKFGEKIPSIILPMNWAYSDSAEFMDQTRQLIRSYIDVERDLPGVKVCPIGIAYEIVFNDYGKDEWLSLYTDNRHPTPKASYLAACMEYAVIFNETPESISYRPNCITPAEADRMKKVASKALEKWVQEKMISR